MARGSRARWFAKRIKQSRREKRRVREKGKEGRRMEREKDRWKETERNTEEAEIFLVPCGFLVIASGPKRPEFTLFLQEAAISFQ